MAKIIQKERAVFIKEQKLDQKVAGVVRNKHAGSMLQRTCSTLVCKFEDISNRVKDFFKSRNSHIACKKLLLWGPTIKKKGTIEKLVQLLCLKTVMFEKLVLQQSIKKKSIFPKKIVNIFHSITNSIEISNMIISHKPLLSILSTATHVRQISFLNCHIEIPPKTLKPTFTSTLHSLSFTRCTFHHKTTPQNITSLTTYLSTPLLLPSLRLLHHVQSFGSHTTFQIPSGIPLQSSGARP
ncbi:unnamed protein product [Moneuplotes crassus]|uniref:Uncharacterized protein n=1 Tax=Euplotes crassus TaxID=5936 RepID=A0AAD1XTX2_EUPCR|nr:unnamed protein product [Moneuplotes crassus]